MIKAEELRQATTQAEDRSEEMKKRALAEGSLFERMAEIEVILGALSDGVVAFDVNCRVRFANSAAQALLGRVGEQIKGLALADMLTVFDVRTGKVIDGLCYATIRDGEPVYLRGNVAIRTAAGFEFDARICAVPAPESGEVAMILVFTDISAEISKARQIEFQAFHDPLTELGNRSMLARDLPPMIEQAQRSVVAGGSLCCVLISIISKISTMPWGIPRATLC